MRHVALDRASEGEIYWPLSSDAAPYVSNLFIRFDPEGHGGLRQVIDALTRNVPTVRVVRADTMRDALGRSVRQREFNGWLFGAFGLAALAIVGVGMLGLIGTLVARRTREIGIRMALGAAAPSVVRLVLVEQLTGVAVGLAAGTLASLWAVRFLGAYLYQMSVYDWRAWTTALAALFGVAIAAAAVPARRAARVDPVRALRET